MCWNNAQNKSESPLADVTPADRVVMMRRISAIAAYFDTALAGIEEMIAERNPNLTAQSWAAAQTVIQKATGRGKVNTLPIPAPLLERATSGATGCNGRL